MGIPAAPCSQNLWTERKPCGRERSYHSKHLGAALAGAAVDPFPLSPYRRLGRPRRAAGRAGRVPRPPAPLRRCHSRLPARPCRGLCGAATRPPADRPLPPHSAARGSSRVLSSRRACRPTHPPRCRHGETACAPSGTTVGRAPVPLRGGRGTRPGCCGRPRRVGRAGCRGACRPCGPRSSAHRAAAGFRGRPTSRPARQRLAQPSWAGCSGSPYAAHAQRGLAHAGSGRIAPVGFESARSPCSTFDA